MADIAVIGLGLIGGSCAMALQGFMGANIYGVDIDGEVIKEAKRRKVIVDGGADPLPFLSRCGLVIVCLYPKQTADFIKKYAKHFKRGCIVVDMCGVKRYIIEQVMPVLDGWFDYVPAHPMAGKEEGGFCNADADLFKGANFIITPHEKTRIESVELVCKMAAHMGTNEPVIADPLHHDKMIAYTSQLAHVIASAFINCDASRVCRGYTAGSFKDVTRVSRINSVLWSELLTFNRDCLTEQIDEFIDEMAKLREIIAHSDAKALKEALSQSDQRKKEWDSENG